MERLGSIDHGKDFASSVEEIINQPLTVENVDTYAEVALDKLIQLIDDMVQVYNHQPTIWLDNSAERENAVFAYYGIEGSMSCLTILLPKRSSSKVKFL